MYDVLEKSVETILRSKTRVLSKCHKTFFWQLRLTIGFLGAAVLKIDKNSSQLLLNDF